MGMLKLVSLFRINSLEDQIKRYKEENVKYQKELNEFAKVSLNLQLFIWSLIVHGVCV